MIEVKGEGFLNQDDVVFLKYLVNDFMFSKDNDFKDLKQFARSNDGLTDWQNFNELVNEKRKEFVMTKVQFDALVHLTIVNKVSFADVLASESKDHEETYVENIKNLVSEAIDMQIESHQKQIVFLASLKLESKTEETKVIEELLQEQVKMMQELKAQWLCEFEVLKIGA